MREFPKQQTPNYQYFHKVIFKSERLMLDE
jgi:hypothetical protein